TLAATIAGTVLADEKRAPHSRQVDLTRSVIPEGVAFNEAAILDTDSPPSAVKPDIRIALPKEIKATEYSLEYARHTLVPAMGGSLAAGDYDGDGRPDLFVIRAGSPGRLLRNNGDGTFTDVTVKAGVTGFETPLSATFADYNHSGHPSLFVAGLGGVALYTNRGDGTFTDETRKRGLPQEPGMLFSHVAVSGIDRDGYPEILVTAYSDLSAPPRKPAFLFPNDFAGASSRLYRNANGAFKDVTVSAGLAGNPGRTRRALFAVFDGGSEPDILLLREDKPPALYVNRGDGTYEDRTWDAGEQLSRNAFVDAQVADFDHDGKLDLALWSTMGNRVLLNRGNRQFELAETAPLVAAPAAPFGFRGAIYGQTGDLLAAGSDGKWHYFANRSGYFREGPCSVLSGIPSASGVDFVLPLRDGSDSLHLFVLFSSGRIAVLRQGPYAPRKQRAME
ncbi:MAG: VCBS repeat-containing protein, partial [Bryobacteraceae bacterium]